MSITFSSNPIYLSDFFKFDREYLRKQESQNAGQKVFRRDTLEISQLSNNRGVIINNQKAEHGRSTCKPYNGNKQVYIYSYIRGYEFLLSKYSGILNDWENLPE